MDKVLNVGMRELCGVTKRMNEKIDEGALRWFCHVERMGNDGITKKVYVGECTCSHSVGKPRKKWIDILKDCLKKRCLDVKQSRRMVHDRSEWRGFVIGNVWSVARG